MNEVITIGRTEPVHTREVKKHIVRTKDRLTKYFYYYYYSFVDWESGNQLYGNPVER